MAGRLAWLSARLMIRPTLSVGSCLPSAPWPWGVVEFAARAITPTPGTVRAGIELAHCTAQLVRAAGVLPADGTRRVVLYLHGGAFLTCGPYSHGRLVSMLSGFADSPVLVPNYRKIPKHSIREAIDDCYDGYRWLRRKGYQPDQIVLAGDSAGGYLALALAQRLLECGEQPAALVAMSPLLQLAHTTQNDAPQLRLGCDVSAQSIRCLPRPDHPRRSTPRRQRASRRALRTARSHPTRTATHLDPCVRLRGAAPRRAAGGPTTSHRRRARRTAGMAGPNPCVPTRRADDPRSCPLTAPDRPLHPRSNRITKGL